MKLFATPDEREQALMVAAAVAMHADISARGLPRPQDLNDCSAQGRIAAAFDIGEQFLAEAERRLQKP